jgi:hypothetical protein
MLYSVQLKSINKKKNYRQKFTYFPKKITPVTEPNIAFDILWINVRAYGRERQNNFS